MKMRNKNLSLCGGMKYPVFKKEHVRPFILYEFLYAAKPAECVKVPKAVMGDEVPNHLNQCQVAQSCPKWRLFCGGRPP